MGEFDSMRFPSLAAFKYALVGLTLAPLWRVIGRVSGRPAG